MKVPKEFKLGGQTYKVSCKPSIEIDGALGIWLPYSNHIMVQTHLNGHAIVKEAIDQTFCHEWGHALMAACRRDDLCADENFIDLLGEFLCQSINTMKYK